MIKDYLRMIISYSGKEIHSWRPLVSTDNGLILEESSITMIKLFYVGLMKRINSKYILCKKEEILKPFL